MSVTFFQMLRPVLTNLVQFEAAHQERTQREILQDILGEAQRNQNEWYSNRVPSLNYELAACRLAYLYIVAAANSNTFKHLLCTDNALRDFVLERATQNRRLRVCALGAGPGTELMAFAKFFHENHPNCCVRVDFQLLDIVQEWQDSWHGIREAIDAAYTAEYGTDLTLWPMFPAGNFLWQDVTQVERMPKLGNLWNQDLFVINFLLSELFHDDPDFRAFIRAITQRAPSGSRFVFIERHGWMWRQRMRNCANEAGITLSDFQESQDNLDGDEDPAHLGPLYRSLQSMPCGRAPRQGWNVVYAVGVKE